METAAEPREWTIAEFCDYFDACKEARDWALANCATPQEAWAKAKPEWVIWIATRPGVLDDCTLRRFACWSVRQVWHLLTDSRSKQAVEVAERFADGGATAEELAAAWDAARAAAWAAAGAAAGDAARAAAWAAAWAAAGAAARDAARAAARDAAWDAARAAAWAAQVAWLRTNATPNYRRVCD